MAGEWDVEYGAPVDLVFTADESTHTFSFPPGGTGVIQITSFSSDPESFRFEWRQADTGEAIEYREGVLVTADISATLTLSLIAASGDTLETSVEFGFSPEPYGEPNDLPARATPLTPGEDVAFRLMPRFDRDVFAAISPGDGAFSASILETGSHPDVRVRWLDVAGAELRPDWESTITVKAGQTYYVEVRSDDYYWGEQAREDPLKLRVDFSAEPYAEPNNIPEQAVALTVGEEISFRLMPRADRDVFAVASLGDGAFSAFITDTAGHPDVRVRWLDITGAELRPDWESTFAVKAGQTYYVEVRSDDYYWGEQSREEPLRLRVGFSAEPYAEPNDIPEQAVALAVGEEIAFRLMPRADRDVFAVTSPGDGTFSTYILETGGHPDVRVRWLDVAGAELRPDWESTLSVETGATYFVEVRSDDYYWGEQSREDPLKLRVDYSAEPYVEPNNIPEQAVALAVGEEIAFRLMPRADRDVFAVTSPGNGAFSASILETGGHPDVRVRWLNITGAELRPDWESTLTVEAGQTYYIEVRSDDYYWGEQAREDLLKLRVDYSAEPYAEPNNIPEQAVARLVGEEITFRLMPRADKDVFAVTSPGDGAFSAYILETGGHLDIRVRWLDITGAEIRTDWESTITVSTGQTYYVEVRSDDYYWGEQSREDPLTLRVDYSAEPYTEPNNTIAEALPAEPGDILTFRLMPRADRDFFIVAPPQGGELVLELLEDGGHPDLTPIWYDATTGAELSRNWVHPVERDTLVALLIISDDYYWSEQARTETVRLWLRLRRPDGSWVGEYTLPEELAMRPWQYITVPAATPVPLIRLTAPQKGLYRVNIEGGSGYAVIWTDESTGDVLEGAVQSLERGRVMTIDIRAPEGVDPPERVVTLELQAANTQTDPGPYPRLPPGSVQALFDRRAP